MNEQTEWKVYAVNDYEWYMAHSPEEAIAAAVAFTGCTEKEITEDETPHLMTPEEMAHFKYVEEDGVTKRTFAQELTFRIQSNPHPQLFASREI